MPIIAQATSPTLPCHPASDRDACCPTLAGRRVGGHGRRSWRRRKGIEAFRVPDGTGNRFFLVSHGKRECRRRHDPLGRKRRALRLSYADSLQNGILQGVAPRPATDGVPTFQARRVVDAAADNAALPSGEAWCLAPRRCGFRREKRVKGRSVLPAPLERHPGHVRKANILPLLLAVSVRSPPVSVICCYPSC